MRPCLPRKLTVAVLALVIGHVCQSLAAKPEPDVAAFIAAKRNQTETTARQLGVRLPVEVTKMFDAAAAADWRSTSNLFATIRPKYAPQEQSAATGRLAPEVWYPVQEVGGFCEFLAYRNPKFIRLFADETFKVVPAGSVYFGGTDPGRFVITALSTSHREGKPFFTITQNQLMATNYLDYVRGMYGARLKLPDRETVKQVTASYVTDARRRWIHDRDFPNERRQLQPGEHIQEVDGHPQASGAVAVMAISGLVAKWIVEANPEKEFYVEESYALDWMYPHLSPAGPIFKLHSTPLDALALDTVREDRRYWSALTERLAGFKVRDDTTLEEVGAFAENIRQATFKGDPDFLRDPTARNNFSKLRSTTAGLYAWRATHPKSAAERGRMITEAEFAFKQAYGLYPMNPETVWRYTMFLIELDHAMDAQKFITFAAKLNPKDPTVTGLTNYVQQVIEWKKTQADQ